MNQTLTLPPVAQSFYIFCKKCDIDRYHRVLAHTTETSAKIECEVCNGRKTYNLPKAGAAARKAKSDVGRAAVRKTAHTGEYEVRNKNKMSTEATPFSVRTKYVENQKIMHPKFGLGFVQKVYNEKIDVIFSDEVKSLVHNRQ